MKAGAGLRLDLPVEEATRLRAKAVLKRRTQANEERYRAHPWPFLCEAVWTLDQRGGAGGGVRQFPGKAIVDPRRDCACAPGGCDNYLHHIVNEWLTYDRLLIPKSRRLIITWTFCALYYWRARYRPASMLALASRKLGQTEDEGSAELVKRIKFIHTHLPMDVTLRPFHYGFARFAFKDNDATIVGVAQGADQARQYTFSDYFADEFAFWERASETYAALIPTLEGGGRFVGVSSASPGFMEQLVYDRWHVGGGA